MRLSYILLLVVGLCGCAQPQLNVADAELPEDVDAATTLNDAPAAPHAACTALRLQVDLVPAVGGCGQLDAATVWATLIDDGVTVLVTNDVPGTQGTAYETNTGCQIDIYQLQPDTTSGAADVIHVHLDIVEDQIDARAELRRMFTSTSGCQHTLTPTVIAN